MIETKWPATRKKPPTRKHSPLSRWAYPEALPNVHQTWREMQDEHNHLALVKESKALSKKALVLAAVIAIGRWATL